MVLEKKRLGVQPQNGIPGFILYFPLEHNYGYLRFEGKVGKKEGKGKGKDKKIIEYAVAGSGIRTHDH